MNEERKYTKLGDLVGRTFTVEKVWGYDWKMWDNTNKKMLRSDKWEKGYQKKWQVVTNHGQMDLGTGQFSSLLEATYNAKEDNSSLVGKKFEVKSNGKTGMEIRYFLNLVRDNVAEEAYEDRVREVGGEVMQETILDDIDEEEPVDLGSIPF